MGKIKQTLALFILIELLFSSFTIQTALGGGKVTVNPPETYLIPGKDVPKKAPEFFERVLEKLGIPLSDFAVKALVIWTKYENTNAYWNPLATTWDMGEKSWNFNDAGVKNYADMETGVQATANTLKLSYYKAILEMLAGKAFNKEEIQKAVATWTYGSKNAVNRMNDPYLVNLVNEWWSEWQAKVPAKPPFEIVKCDISPKKVRIEERVSFTVTIKNMDNIARKFSVSFAVQDPNGNWHTSPSKDFTVSPENIGSVNLEWFIDSSALAGHYNVNITIWASELNKMETKEIINAFEVLGEAEKKEVNLPVPYIHQYYDTPLDEFNGKAACGATSTVMVLAYYGKLKAWPCECSAPYEHISLYGNYVPKAHQYIFDPQIRKAIADKIVQYLRKHGIDAIVIWEQPPTPEEIKKAIDQGRPIIASTQLTSEGHVVVIKGYTSDGYYIVNDPYGKDAKGGYDGAEVQYTWSQMKVKWAVIPITPP